MSSLDDLKEQLRKGNVIPFVGAGVSMNVKDKEGKRIFPSWKGFLEGAIDKLRLEDSDEKKAYATLANSSLNASPPDYLKAAKHAREGFGIGWNKFLDQQFNPDRAKVENSSLEVAKLIWRLGSSLTITTNFDDVLKWGSDDRATKLTNGQKFQLGKIVGDGLPQHPTVWNLHGHISEPSGVILTPDGFNKLYPDDSNAKIEYEAAFHTLRRLLGSYTFLFVGFSLSDADFVNQIRYISELFEGATRDHYALVKDSDKDFVNGLNLQVKPITYEDHGPPLIQLLRELVELVGDSDASELVYKPLIHAADYSPEKPAFFVPFRSKGKDVIGRDDDLEKVRRSLVSGKATRIGQAVLFEGMGGLGKTQLAVEYAYKYRNEPEYKNGIIWITVDQDIDKQLVELAEKSEWISPKSESKDKLAVALHRLKTISDCLIIFDNIESLDEIEDYLPDSRENVHLLATSRKELGGFKPISIDLLTLEESVEMLERESARKVNEEEVRTAREIAESLGRLPLALELAGAYLLNRENISWQEYLDLLVTNPKSVFLDKFKDSSFTEHEADVYRTLKISEDLLSEDVRLREILDLLTWSGSSPMGISLMCDLLGVDREAELTNALSLGVKLRFLQESPDRKGYAIHRLVAQVRREDIPLGGRKDWVELVCQRLGDWFQGKREEFTELSEYESEIEHLSVWQKQSLDFATQYASRLLWLQAYPSYHRGRYKESQDLIEKAIEVYDQTSCRDLEVLSNLWHDCGITASFFGDYSTAFDFLQKAFDLRVELFGEMHPDTATSYEGLGGSYGDLGDYKKQLEFYQKGLEIRRQLFGEKHSDTARSYSNLADINGTLGDFNKQLESDLEALHIRLELFGEMHPDTAMSYSDLGDTYGSLGDYEKQLEFNQKALNIYVELFGEKHPETAASLNSLGIAYGSLEGYDKQLEFCQKALTIGLELFGEKHPATATSFDSLGIAYGYLGNPNKELELNQRALDIRLELFDEKHPVAAISYANLGSTYGRLGRYDKQLELYKKNLKISLELFGETHPATASSYDNLGYAFRCLDDFDSAIAYGEKAVALRQTILGKPHPLTLESVHNLIIALIKNTRRDKFLEMKTRALNLIKEYLAVVSPASSEYLRLQHAKTLVMSVRKEGFRFSKKKRYKKAR